jgi:hypothetical protein
MRARLRDSADPDRIFRVTKEVAASAGLIGVKRVLDSTPLYDAVATQDTVTLIRGAIRGVLRACPEELAQQIRRYLRRDDDYARPGKPPCDWDDPQAREDLVDALVRDGLEVLKELEGRTLEGELKRAAELLATVIGQDIEQTPDGTFRIARRVAPDRVISTVDPESRHGHKTQARGFDGYKGHVAIDPDSEIITAAEVGTANKGDAEMLPKLLAGLGAGEPEAAGDAQVPDGDHATAEPEPVTQDPESQLAPGDEPAGEQSLDADPVRAQSADEDAAPNDEPTPHGEPQTPVVYGDSAYGSGEALALLAEMGATPMVKVQDPHAPGGRFPKDRFVIDLSGATVTCPNDVTVALRPLNDGGGYASFGKTCASCPLRARCTAAKDGRVISVSVHEARLQEARQTQADPNWQADYKATRPKVERKQAHLMRRRHGGRRARVRGKVKLSQDFRLLAAAANLARLAVLGVTSRAGGWVAATI